MLLKTWGACLISFCLASVCSTTGDELSTSTTLLPTNNGSLSSKDQTNTLTEGVKEVLDLQVHASNDTKSNVDNLTFNGNQDLDTILEALNLDSELKTTKDEDTETADNEGNQNEEIEDFLSTLTNDTNGKSTELARASIIATKNDRIDSANSCNEPLNATLDNGMENNSNNSQHLGTTMLRKGNDRTVDINIEPLKDTLTEMNNVQNSTHVDKSVDEQLRPDDTGRNKNEIDSSANLWSFLSPSQSLESEKNLAKDFSEPKSDGTYKNIDEPVNTKEECTHVTLTTIAHVEKELHETMPISVMDVISSMTSTSGCPNSRENLGSNDGTTNFKEHDSNARKFHGNFVTGRDFPPHDNIFQTHVAETAATGTTTMRKSIMKDFSDTENKTNVNVNRVSDIWGNILKQQNGNSEVQKFEPHTSLILNKVKQVGKLGRIKIGQGIGPSSYSRFNQKISAKENQVHIITRTRQMVDHPTSHISVPMRDGIHLNKKIKNQFSPIKEQTNDPTSTSKYSPHVTTGKPKGFRFVYTDNKSIFHYSDHIQKGLQSRHIITRKPIIILDNIASVLHTTVKNEQRGLPPSINLLSLQIRARTVEHVENNLIHKRTTNIKGIHGTPTILETPWENGFTTKHTSTSQPVCTSTHNQKIEDISLSKDKVMDIKKVPSLKPGKFLPDILDWNYNDAYGDRGLKFKISNAQKDNKSRQQIQETNEDNKSRIETIKGNSVQKLFNAEVKSEGQPSIHKKTEILFTTFNEAKKVTQNLQDITDGQGHTTTSQISIKNSFDSSEEVNIQPVPEDNVLNIPTEQDILVSQTLNIETITTDRQSLGIHNNVYNSSNVMGRMEELYKDTAEEIDEIINDQEYTNTNEQENTNTNEQENTNTNEQESNFKEQESTSNEEQEVNENKNMNMDVRSVVPMKNDQSEINNYAGRISNHRENYNQDENGNSGDIVKVEMETDNNGEDTGASQDMIDEAEYDNVVSNREASHNGFNRDVSLHFAGYPDAFPDSRNRRIQLGGRTTTKEPAKERKRFRKFKVSHKQDVLNNIRSGYVRISIDKPILNLPRRGMLVFNNKLVKTHTYPKELSENTDIDTAQADTENKDTTPSLWYKARKKSEEDTTTTTHKNVQEDYKELKGVWNTALDKVDKLNLMDQFYSIMHSVLKTPHRVMTLSEQLVKILTSE